MSIEIFTKTSSSGIGALKRVRALIDQDTAIKAYEGFLEPYVSYSCAT
jgi:hypothetical protein